MKWIILKNISDIEVLKELSEKQKVLIYKHSNRCNICSTTLNHLEKKWKMEDTDKLSPHFIDVIAMRSVSNQITKYFGIKHKSPQVLIIDKKRCIYTASHLNIEYHSIMKYAS